MAVYVPGERVWRSLKVLNLSIIESAHWELFWPTPMRYTMLMHRLVHKEHGRRQKHSAFNLSG